MGIAEATAAGAVAAGIAGALAATTFGLFKSDPRRPRTCFAFEFGAGAVLATGTGLVTGAGLVTGVVGATFSMNVCTTAASCDTTSAPGAGGAAAKASAAAAAADAAAIIATFAPAIGGAPTTFLRIGMSVQTEGRRG